MNIFQLSISTLVFGITLLLGTTAVIASRFVITTVASLAKPVAAPERIIGESEQVAVFDDFRNKPARAPNDFDATGSYSLDLGKVPVAFAGIGFLKIVTTEFSYDRENKTYTRLPVVPTGMLQTGMSLAFTKIAVGNREISFETATDDGVRYQFIGNFPVIPEFIECEECELPANLTGRLKKLRNGEMIAEMDAKFYYVGR